MCYLSELCSALLTSLNPPAVCCAPRITPALFCLGAIHTCSPSPHCRPSRPSSVATLPDLHLGRHHFSLLSPQPLHCRRAGISHRQLFAAFPQRRATTGKCHVHRCMAVEAPATIGRGAAAAQGASSRARKAGCRHHQQQALSCATWLACAHPYRSPCPLPLPCCNAFVHRPSSPPLSLPCGVVA